MGVLGKLSNWVEAPYTAFYECPSCGGRFEEHDSSCPECGDELESDEALEVWAYYWGPM